MYKCLSSLKVSKEFKTRPENRSSSTDRQKSDGDSRTHFKKVLYKINTDRY